MKLHPDGVAEGTPEECAAFKHIDAALAARNKPRMKAIEGPKKTPAKKVPSKRVKTRRTRAQLEQLNEQIINLAAAKDGINTADVALYFEMPKKTAYNHLYRLRGAGRLWLTDNGVFKVDRTKEHV